MNMPPNMQLKYDIWYSSKEISNEIVYKFNALFITFITDCNREDMMVRYYLSRNSSLGIEGSYEKDLKVLFDTKYTWGCRYIDSKVKRFDRF